MQSEKLQSKPTDIKKALTNLVDLLKDNCDLRENIDYSDEIEEVLKGIE